MKFTKKKRLPRETHSEAFRVAGGGTYRALVLDGHTPRVRRAFRLEDVVKNLCLQGSTDLQSTVERLRAYLNEKDDLIPLSYREKGTGVVRRAVLAQAVNALNSAWAMADRNELLSPTEQEVATRADRFLTVVYERAIQALSRRA